MVSGSELYEIVIRIKKLPDATWASIRDQCSGHIGSMLELLQGKLSDQVMAIVTNRHHGLFTQPGEIDFDCSCPDWAMMCKHVAAVLYGVGSRLDSRPALLFLLRDVDAEELITAEMTLPDAAATGDTLADDQLGAIFGIDLDTDAPHAPQTPAQKRPQKQPRATRRGVATSTRQPVRPVPDRKSAPAASPAGRSPRAAHTGARREPAPSPAATTMPRRAQGCHQHPVKDTPHRQIGGSPAPPAGTVRRPVCRTTWRFTCDRVPLGSHQGPLNLQARLLHALATLQQQHGRRRQGA